MVASADHRMRLWTLAVEQAHGAAAAVDHVGAVVLTVAGMDAAAVTLVLAKSPREINYRVFPVQGQSVTVAVVRRRAAAPRSWARPPIHATPGDFEMESHNPVAPAVSIGSTSVVKSRRTRSGPLPAFRSGTVVVLHRRGLPSRGSFPDQNGGASSPINANVTPPFPLLRL